MVKPSNTEQSFEVTSVPSGSVQHLGNSPQEVIHLPLQVQRASEGKGIDPGAVRLAVSNLDVKNVEPQKVNGLLKDALETSCDQQHQYLVSSAVVYRNKKSAVLNIGGVLNLSENPCIGDTSRAEHFKYFFENLDLKKTGKIDCIQMPMIVTDAGRKHFVQLQFFRDTTTNGLGVRLIDSTGNPFGIPNKELKKFVASVAPSVDRLLQIQYQQPCDKEAPKKLIPFKIYSVFTEAQSSTPIVSPDKKCGLYVLGGIKAVTDKVLAQGDHFLSSNDSVNRVVSNEHHCVNKSRVENYFLSRVLRNIFSKDSKKTSDNFDALCKKLQLVDDNVCSDIASDKKSASGVLTREEGVSSGFASHQSFQDLGSSPSVFAPLGKENCEDPKIEVVRGTIIDVVRKALDEYKKNHRAFGSFFRHLSTAGLRYVEQAQIRMAYCSNEERAAVCKQIAREILSQALTSDGRVKVDTNSRVYWLLKEMEAGGFSTLNNNVDKMRGKKVSMGDIVDIDSSFTATETRSSSILSADP